MPDVPSAPVTVPEQPKETPSRSEAVQKIVEMRDQLKRQAEMAHSGAASNATATMLLDKTDAERLNPGKRLRWVSIRNAQKAAMRQATGYERVPAEEGGRQVGDLILMRLPGEEHAKRVHAIKELTQARLDAHNKESEQIAEGLARELRDRHGIKIRPEDLFGPKAGTPSR